MFASSRRSIRAFSLLSRWKKWGRELGQGQEVATYRAGDEAEWMVLRYVCFITNEKFGSIDWAHSRLHQVHIPSVQAIIMSADARRRSTCGDAVSLKQDGEKNGPFPGGRSKESIF